MKILKFAFLFAALSAGVGNAAVERLSTKYTQLIPEPYRQNAVSTKSVLDLFDFDEFFICVGAEASSGKCMQYIDITKTKGGYSWQTTAILQAGGFYKLQTKVTLTLRDGLACYKPSDYIGSLRVYGAGTPLPKIGAADKAMPDLSQSFAAALAREFNGVSEFCDLMSIIGKNNAMGFTLHDGKLGPASLQKRNMMIMRKSEFDQMVLQGLK